MTGPLRSDMDSYQAVLTEIGARLETADRYLTGTGTMFDAESAATQLRIVLELIVTGSLVANREAIAKVSSVLKIKDAAEARRTVRAVNPDYWPKPIARRQAGERHFEMLAVDDPVLTEEDWGREFGFVSDLLHARTPHEPPRGLQADAERLQDLSNRIKALLKEHWITLLGARDAIAGRLDIANREVQAAIFKRLPEEDPTS